MKIEDRLTGRSQKNNLAYLVKVRLDEQSVESPYPDTLKAILESFQRLAEYEDTGRGPEEITALDHDVAMFKQSARLANELANENGKLREQIKRLEASLSHYE